MKEVTFLRKRDSKLGKIDFVDISSPEYNPKDNMNISFEEAMESIHAITADGKIITGIEVFQRLYEAVGLGWVYAITKWEPAFNAASGLYNLWAKYRLPITGRPALKHVLESRLNEGKECGSSEEVACEIVWDEVDAEATGGRGAGKM